MKLTRRQKYNRVFLGIALLLVAAIPLLWFINGKREAARRSILADENSLIVKTFQWKNKDTSPTLTFKTQIRNRSSVSWERLVGNLDFYQGNRELYGCRARVIQQVEAGEEISASFTVNNSLALRDLAACPIQEVSYTWTPTEVVFPGDTLLQKGMIILPILLGVEILFLWIRARRWRRQQARANAPQTVREDRSYGTSSPAGGYRYYPSSLSEGGGPKGRGESNGGAGTKPSERPVNNPQKEKQPIRYGSGSEQRAAYASRQRAGYASQGLTRNAEEAAHRARTAFGDVLAENTELSRWGREEFRSAQSSFEHASRELASYRSSGESQRVNAEEAAHRMRTAQAKMMGAVAREKGDPQAFASAKSSYEYASRQAASYRSSGSTENALQSEHRMRTAFAEMLRASAPLEGQAKSDFQHAQKSLDYASWQATSYRTQGISKDAERNEDMARRAQADMLKAMASGKGNRRDIESAHQNYINASRRYAEYKNQGLERDAQRCQSDMDRAMAEMMKYI